jgi:F-BAR domain only protein
VAGTENLAQSHETLAQKIESDVETPLRQFATKNREMQSMTTIQGNLTAIAKDFESAQKKVEKLRDKSGRPDRVANASSSVDDASQQWESQAPYVFEQLQSLDETRVNFLRDALTQFQTHEVDQVERNRTSAESCLNALLNIETADEIKTFAAKISGGAGSTLRRRSSAATGARPQSASLVAPPTPPSRGFEDSSGSRFGASTGQDRLTPSTLPVRAAVMRSTNFCVVEEKSKKSSFGGIKRIGTVMSRRKSTAPPPPTPEKRKDKSRFPFRRGDSSRSFQEVDSPPPTSVQGLTPVQSQDPGPPRVPQPHYTRGETNGLASQDGASDIPRTNGNNSTGPPTARNMDQPLPQVSQHSLQDAKSLTSWPDTSRAQRRSCFSVFSSGCI